MRRLKIGHFLLFVGISAGLAVAEPIVLESCEALDFWKVTRAPAKVAPVPDAAVGTGALEVTMPGMLTRILARRYVPGSAVWDRYEGLSFWVKGDGSDRFGCLAVKGAYAFVTYFPLDDATWHKVTRHWDEFVPESPVKPIGAYGSLPPSGITSLRIGSRWRITHNNQRIQPYSFCIDQIQLEEKVPQPPKPPPARPFAEVLARLKQGKSLRIQCMGDSITAGTGLPDATTQRYAARTQALLRQWLGRDNIDCFSRAVGGAKLTDARAWVPRDFHDPTPPDLVTIWYGYNDKSNAHSAAYFESSLEDYIDRICRATRGQSAILLFATGPGTGPRFVMMDDFADRVRAVAKRRGVPCFDIHAALKAIGREHIQDFFTDMAHPNEEGHRFIADKLCEFLVAAAGIDTPKPAPPPKPDVPPGQAKKWTFEDDAAGWKFQNGVRLSSLGEVAGSGKGICFAIAKPGKDHARAWAPALPVIPGQKYTVGTDLFVKKLGGAERFGLYVCTYPAADGTGNYAIRRVAGGEPIPRWGHIEGKWTVPAGVKSMRILVWASKDTTGLFYFDNVEIRPVEK